MFPNKLGVVETTAAVLATVGVLAPDETIVPKPIPLKVTGVTVVVLTDGFPNVNPTDVTPADVEIGVIVAEVEFVLNPGKEVLAALDALTATTGLTSGLSAGFISGTT